MSVQIREVEHTRVVADVPGSLEELLERAGEYIQGPKREGALRLIEGRLRLRGGRARRSEATIGGGVRNPPAGGGAVAHGATS